MRGLDLRAAVVLALVATVAISSLRAPAESQVTQPVQIIVGTGHLIDGHHVDYAWAYQAAWTATKFWLSNEGTFRFTLRNQHLSDDVWWVEDPAGGSEYLSPLFVGSAVLFRVIAFYVLPGWGDMVSYPLHPVVAQVCEPFAGRLCRADIEGSFEVPAQDRGYWNFTHLEIQLSWIRVFRTDAGFLFFQWLQGDSGARAQSDIFHRYMSGRYLVYHPLYEGLTRPLQEDENFDYVAWLKANLPGLW